MVLQLTKVPGIVDVSCEVFGFQSYGLEEARQNWLGSETRLYCQPLYSAVSEILSGRRLAKVRESAERVRRVSLYPRWR